MTDLQFALILVDTGLSDVARARRATHVVIPYRQLGGVKRPLERPLADQLIQRLPEIEIHVVGSKADGREHPGTR
jgi:K+-sensing histidine kinase KdpD